MRQRLHLSAIMYTAFAFLRTLLSGIHSLPLMVSSSTSNHMFQLSGFSLTSASESIMPPLQERDTSKFPILHRQPSSKEMSRLLQTLFEFDLISRNTTYDCFFIHSGRMSLAHNVVTLQIVFGWSRHKTPLEKPICTSEHPEEEKDITIAWSRAQIISITSVSLILGLFFVVAFILRLKSWIKRKKEKYVTKRGTTKQRVKYHHCLDDTHDHYSMKNSFSTFADPLPLRPSLNTGLRRTQGSRSVPRIGADYFEPVENVQLINMNHTSSNHVGSGSIQHHSPLSPTREMSSALFNKSQTAEEGGDTAQSIELEELLENDTLGGLKFSIRASPNNYISSNCVPQPPTAAGSKKKFGRRHSLTEEIDSVLHKYYRNRPTPAGSSFRSRSSNNIAQHAIPSSTGPSKVPARMMSLTPGAGDSVSAIFITSNTPSNTMKRGGKLSDHLLVRGPGSLRMKKAHDGHLGGMAGFGSKGKLERRATITSHRLNTTNSAFHRPVLNKIPILQNVSPLSPSPSTTLSFPTAGASGSGTGTGALLDIQKEIENYCAKAPISSDKKENAEKSSVPSSHRNSPSPGQQVTTTSCPPLTTGPTLSHLNKLKDESCPRSTSNASDVIISRSSVEESGKRSLYEAPSEPAESRIC